MLKDIFGLLHLKNKSMYLKKWVAKLYKTFYFMSLLNKHLIKK